MTQSQNPEPRPPSETDEDARARAAAQAWLAGWHGRETLLSDELEREDWASPDIGRAA